MTNNRNYYTSSNYATTIPSREEFHRYASNTISISDFETGHTSGIQVEKVVSSIIWTIKNDKKRIERINNKKKGVK